MALKVIGAGFGRTGTRSLKSALEQLGFGRCYHMEEVVKNPTHLKHWAEIMEGGRADWETLFRGYQSATDWPVAAYYKDLMAVYPESKIILTVRDPESWHRSVMNTLYQAGRGFFGRFTRILPSAHRFLNAMEKGIWEGIFHNKLEDKAHAVAVFQKHIEEVKRIVPKERLLIFEAKHGWEPLCSFLNVSVPANKPYPHRNKGALVRQILKYGKLMKHH
ncbi:MAG TPA: sulfotransferase [Anaerolineales bacterium]|nr:sulfotransferase [Anaerolineales bacterium]